MATVKRVVVGSCNPSLKRTTLGAYIDGFSKVWEANASTSTGASRQPSTTSNWDVGNPPIKEDNESTNDTSHPNRQEDSPTPSLEKETSAREFFHVKAKETEDRLSQEKSKEQESK